MMIIGRWENMGPEWKTEDIFRIRELLKENRIPFRMPASDLFCASVFHMPDKDKRWSILVRDKDRLEAAALLIREGLADKSLLPGFFCEPKCKKRSFAYIFANLHLCYTAVNTLKQGRCYPHLMKKRTG